MSRKNSSRRTIRAIPKMHFSQAEKESFPISAKFFQEQSDFVAELENGLESLRQVIDQSEGLINKIIAVLDIDNKGEKT